MAVTVDLIKQEIPQPYLDRILASVAEADRDAFIQKKIDSATVRAQFRLGSYWDDLSEDVKDEIVKLETIISLFAFSEFEGVVQDKREELERLYEAAKKPVVSSDYTPVMEEEVSNW